MKTATKRVSGYEEVATMATAGQDTKTGTARVCGGCGATEGDGREGCIETFPAQHVWLPTPPVPGVSPEAWRAVADLLAVSGGMPCATEVVAEAGCSEAEAFKAIDAYARYHGRGTPAAPARWWCTAGAWGTRGGRDTSEVVLASPGAGAWVRYPTGVQQWMGAERLDGMEQIPAPPAPRGTAHPLAGLAAALNRLSGLDEPAAPGAVYLDPADGELVRVLPASAWLPDRWGPREARLTVVKIMNAASGYEREGEICQRDLSRCVLLIDGAGEVPAALRALAGAEGGERSPDVCGDCGTPILGHHGPCEALASESDGGEGGS
jgi:hypothetical protein